MSKKLLGWILALQLISLNLFMVFGLCEQSTILTDNGNDVYMFEVETLNDLTDEDLDDEISVEVLDEVYYIIERNLDSGIKSSTPDEADVLNVNYDSTDLELTFLMDSNYGAPDTDILIGYFWSTETIYVIFFSTLGNYFAEIDEDKLDDLETDDFHEADIDADLIKIDHIKEGFNTEGKISGILLYYDADHEDEVYIELLSTESAISYIFLILFVILALVLLAIVIYLIYKWKKRAG